MTRVKGKPERDATMKVANTYHKSILRGGHLRRTARGIRGITPA